MAEELQGEIDRIEVELIEGSGGVFVVTADGKQVYSKKETGRFPEPGEVGTAIRDSD